MGGQGGAPANGENRFRETRTGIVNFDIDLGAAPGQSDFQRRMAGVRAIIQQVEYGLLQPWIDDDLRRTAVAATNQAACCLRPDSMSVLA